MRVALLTASALVLLGACGPTVQNTSGKAYLARTKSPPAATETISKTRTTRDGKTITEKIEILSTDALVRKAANVEPILRLPARIGLARIDTGRLSVIPDHEARIWQDVVQRFPGLGEAVPIDPFLAEYTTETVLPQDQRRLRTDARNIITKIRLGAARQHVDAVLIYEVGSIGGGTKIPGLTMAGVLGRQVWRSPKPGHDGVARAILLDVRNGYPYATIMATADLDGAKPDFWVDDGDEKAYAEATRRIVQQLSVEVDVVFRKVVQGARRKRAGK